MYITGASARIYIYIYIQYIYSDHVYFRYSCQNVNVVKRVVNFSIRPDYSSDFCLGLSVGPPA